MEFPERKRVVEIDWEGGYGSGYLVAPGVVLTACHVLEAEGKPPPEAGFVCRIRAVGEDRHKRPEWDDAELIWTGKGESDIAVLHAASRDRTHKVPRFGKAPDSAAEIKCRTIGFPKATSTTSAGDDIYQLDGTIRTATFWLTGNLTIDVDSKPPKDAESWPGISGAALFADEFLVGVVKSYSREFGGNTIKAAPLAPFAGDPDFCAALGQRCPLPFHILDSTSRTGALRPSRPLSYNSPSLPPNYQERLEALNVVKTQLFSETHQLGVQGMAGIGKTVLATAVVLDDDVRATFSSGTIWLSFGREADPAQKQAELAGVLSGEPHSFRNWEEGRGQLSQLTQTERLLVVLDDVWRIDQVDAFSRLGPDCRLLVTTRDQRILERLGGVGHKLDLLSPEAALKLLGKAVGFAAADLPAEAPDVARECGYLPLALVSIGALIAKGRFTWAEALDRLRRADIKRFKAVLPEYEHEGVLAALEVSVKALIPKNADGLPDHNAFRDRDAFLDCAVFPEDVTIPEAVLIRLWSPRFEDPEDARDLANRLVDLTLLRREQVQSADGDGCAIWHYRLHDLYRDYLTHAAAPLPPRHEILLHAYEHECPNGWPSGPNDGYFFKYLPHHLVEAGKREALCTLLSDYRWIAVKLKTVGVAAVIGDYNRMPDSEDLSRVQQTLRLSGHVLASDPRQLPAQLLGRLAPEDGDSIAVLLADAHNYAVRPSLLPIRPTLNPPGTSLIRTFTGHQRPITAVAVTRDGQMALSASMDGTLRLWDLETAKELRCLGNHKTLAMSVAMLPDGKRALSGTQDRTLCLWDLRNGTQLSAFKGHKGGVIAVAVLPDGQRALSGAEDWTVRVWDIKNGEELLCFHGHQDWVTAVAVTSDGQRALSGSFDRTLRLWDMVTGTELRCFEGHEGTVRAVSIALDGRCAVSGSDDRTVRLWDLQTGAELHRLDGHEGRVTGVVVLAEGRHAVSASEDRTLRLWDLETRAELHCFYGHKGGATAVVALPDGERALSGSQDAVLALWDLKGRVSRRSHGHDRVVSAVAVTPDEKCILSASADRTLRLWDLQSGTEIHRFEGHLQGINDVAVTPDGRRALSASYDGTLRLWDLEIGKELFRFESHEREVTAVAVTPCGRYAVSGSFDDTLRLWDLQRGAELRCFVGHQDGVTMVAVTPDGCSAISSSLDRSLRLWDLESGEERRCLLGHQDAATAVVVTPDGRHAISGSYDGTMRIWDLASGIELRRSQRHENYVRVLDVTPDSKVAATAYLDYVLYLWDLNTCTKSAAFQGDEPITCCAVASGGCWVVAGDQAGRIHVLEISG